MFANLSVAKNMVIDCIQAGLVPYLQSSPGIGKSAIVKEIAQEYDLQLIDIRLSQLDPVDLNGFGAVQDGIAKYIPFDTFPLATTPLPKGKNGWVLFLDEMSSAPPAIQAAAYKLVLDRMVGQAKLHSKVAIVAAGNLITDNAVVSPISTALQSRVIHIKVAASLEDFKAWAYKNNINNNVISFLNFKPDYLHKFDPDHDDCTFPCPRTWEFASRLLSNFNNLPDYAPILFQGVVGTGVGLEFYTFLEIQRDLVTYDEIIASPFACRMPTEPSTQWALIGHIVSQVNAKDLPKALKFVERMPIEFQVIFVKDLKNKDSSLLRTPEIQQWINVNATSFR